MLENKGILFLLGQPAPHQLEQEGVKAGLHVDHEQVVLVVSICPPDTV